MRFSNLPTYVLLAVYSVVALTGDSLHYWLPDVAFSFQASSDEPSGSGGDPNVGAEQTSFTHYHAPDYHWHAHRHSHGHSHPHHHGGTAQSGSRATQSAEEQTPQPSRESRSQKSRHNERDSVQDFGIYHQDHACPWLSVVAQLELGIGEVAFYSLGCQPKVDLSRLGSESSDSAFLRLLLARGPPA